MAAVSHGNTNSLETTKQLIHHFGGYSKQGLIKGYSQNHKQQKHCDSCESAREQRTALYKSDQSTSQSKHTASISIIGFRTMSSTEYTSTSTVQNQLLKKKKKKKSTMYQTIQSEIQ